MILFSTAFLVVCVAVTGVACWWLARSPRGVLASRARARVLVTTKSGDVFAGVLYETDHRMCVLRDASVIGDGGATIAADGELLVFREDVAYIQVP